MDTISETNTTMIPLSKNHIPAHFLARLECTGKFAFAHFMQLLPIFIYTSLLPLLFFAVIAVIGYLYIQSTGADMTHAESLMHNSTLIFGVLIFIVIWVLGYLTILILSQIIYIESINRVFLKEPVSFTTSLSYATKRFWKASMTYYYMFEYSWLIVCVIFMGMLIYLFPVLAMREANPGQWFSQNSSIIFGFPFVLFIAMLFGIYRSIRSYFALYHAIICDDYTRSSFKNSIAVTRGNSMRFIGNSIAFGLMFLMGSMLLGWVFHIFFPAPMSLSGLSSGLSLSGIDPQNPFSTHSMDAMLATNLKSMSDQKFLLSEAQSFIKFGSEDILNWLLSGISVYLSSIFYFLYYQRLLFEGKVTLPTLESGKSPLEL